MITFCKNLLFHRMAQLECVKSWELVHGIGEELNGDAVLQLKAGQLAVRGGRHSFEPHHLLLVYVLEQNSQRVSKK